MANYSKLRETAAKLIKANGKAITLTRTVQGAYDPASGGTTDTTTTVIGNGVLLRYSNRDIDGTNVLSSDRKMIYAGQVPEVNDRYNLERVVSIETLDPDESGALMFTCQLRK